jgi:hypothetical protein
VRAYAVVLCIIYADGKRTHQGRMDHLDDPAAPGPRGPGRSRVGSQAFNGEAITSTSSKVGVENADSDPVPQISMLRGDTSIRLLGDG